jgi:CRP-like cAMP-binding protein
VDNGRLYLPLTQQDLANASGLSAVHVNRTLKELRQRGFAWESREVKLLDFDGLKRLAEFEPEHLRSKPF